jgi:hypothetical protein
MVCVAILTAPLAANHLPGRGTLAARHRPRLGCGERNPLIGVDLERRVIMCLSRLRLVLGLLLAASLAALGVAPAVAGSKQHGLPPALDSLRAPLTDQNFYFVMQDRFANGSRSNDAGGLSGDRNVTGYDPTSKAFYHGGDLIGLLQQLDYIEGLGTTAIWMTPSFKNKPVQAIGTPFTSAGYHGYWALRGSADCVVGCLRKVTALRHEL